MDRQSTVEAELEALERCLLDPVARKSNQLEALLAPGFIEIGSSGLTFDRAQIVASVNSEVDVLRTAANFRVELLAPTVALVTYSVCRHSQPEVRSLRSSLWQRNTNGGWQMRFHQGTLAGSGQ
jgi:hypothetical protein